MMSIRRSVASHYFESQGGGGAGNDLIPAAPNLADDASDHGSTEGEIFDAIKNGVAPDFNMVPWKDQLKDPDIWSVVIRPSTPFAK